METSDYYALVCNPPRIYTDDSDGNACDVYGAAWPVYEPQAHFAVHKPFPFDDVEETDWAYESIEYVYAYNNSHKDAAVLVEEAEALIDTAQRQRP